jgi:hypothetical protein
VCLVPCACVTPIKDSPFLMWIVSALLYICLLGGGAIVAIGSPGDIALAWQADQLAKDRTCDWNGVAFGCGL